MHGAQLLISRGRGFERVQPRTQSRINQDLEDGFEPLWRFDMTRLDVLQEHG